MQPNENVHLNKNGATIQLTIVNNYGGNNNVSIGNNNQNKQEITGNKNDSNDLSWTIAGVVVAIIGVVVAIIGIVAANLEKIFG